MSEPFQCATIGVLKSKENDDRSCRFIRVSNKDGGKGFVSLAQWLFSSSDEKITIYYAKPKLGFFSSKVSRSELVEMKGAVFRQRDVLFLNVPDFYSNWLNPPDKGMKDTWNQIITNNVSQRPPTLCVLNEWVDGETALLAVMHYDYDCSCGRFSYMKIKTMKVARRHLLPFLFAPSDQEESVSTKVPARFEELCFILPQGESLSTLHITTLQHWLDMLHRAGYNITPKSLGLNYAYPGIGSEETHRLFLLSHPEFKTWEVTFKPYWYYQEYFYKQGFELIAIDPEGEEHNWLLFHSEVRRITNPTSIHEKFLDFVAKCVETFGTSPRRGNLENLPWLLHGLMNTVWLDLCATYHGLPLQEGLEMLGMSSETFEAEFERFFHGMDVFALDEKRRDVELQLFFEELLSVDLVCAFGREILERATKSKKVFPKKHLEFMFDDSRVLPIKNGVNKIMSLMKGNKWITRDELAGSLMMLFMLKAEGKEELKSKHLQLVQGNVFNAKGRRVYLFLTPDSIKLAKKVVKNGVPLYFDELWMAFGLGLPVEHPVKTFLKKVRNPGLTWLELVRNTYDANTSEGTCMTCSKRFSAALTGYMDQLVQNMALRDGLPVLKPFNLVDCVKSVVWLKKQLPTVLVSYVASFVFDFPLLEGFGGNKPKRGCRPVVDLVSRKLGIL